MPRLLGLGLARLLACVLIRAEPLLLSCAENDHAFDAGSRRKALDILQREKKSYHMQLFHGVAHGFAVRGDPTDPYQRMNTVRYSGGMS